MIKVYNAPTIAINKYNKYCHDFQAFLTKFLLVCQAFFNIFYYFLLHRIIIDRICVGKQDI